MYSSEEKLEIGFSISIWRNERFWAIAIFCWISSGRRNFMKSCFLSFTTVIPLRSLGRRQRKIGGTTWEDFSILLNFEE